MTVVCFFIFCLLLIQNEKNKQNTFHLFSTEAGRTTHGFSQEATMWNMHYNLIPGLTVFAHWQPRSTPHDLQKKLQFQSRSPETGHSTLGQIERPPKSALTGCQHHPHPSRASINWGRDVPQSWSCAHVNCQLVATGGKQKVKGRAGHPDSVQEAQLTRGAEEAQRPRPQSQHTLPATRHRLPQRPFQQQ